MKAIDEYIMLIALSMVISMRSIAAELPVLPYPQHVQEGVSSFTFTVNVSFNPVALDSSAMNRLSKHWKQFSTSVRSAAASKMILTIGILGKDSKFDAQIQRSGNAYGEQIGKEGYILILNAKQQLLAANTETGLFYGLQTLKQLTRAGWHHEIYITDWPAFGHRAVYDDISRGPISTVAYIKKQIDRLAELKINALSFYIEHVVQPLSHPDFAPANGKLTIPQIKELAAYAEDHHMQLVGSFQSFGHFEKILALPQYKSMGETSTLISPLDPRARQFLEDVIGELCEAFNAPYFNVNCDETFDLGKGRSKKYIDSIGADRFYADHIRFLYDVLKRHNKKMMMWGDIALEHESILDMLPDDIIYLTWEYGEMKSYNRFIQPFAKRKLNFMVCPGVLNSYRMFPDMVMAKANINTFVKEGSKAGAEGVVTTVWDDGSAYLFSGDWYGIYAAAEKSWNVSEDHDTSFNRRYGLTAYGTSDGNYVKALFKLMELRSIQLTYNLNEQVWRQKLLPDSGRKLIVNNSSAKAALQIVNDADKLLLKAAAKRNQPDLGALRHSIDQYKLIIESRLQLAGIAEAYRQALAFKVADKAKTLQVLAKNEIAVLALKKRYEKLRNDFKAAWLAENQLYWLDVVLAIYDKKITDLNELAKSLHTAVLNAGQQKALPSVQAMRLDIRESAAYYFQNWMLGGPFPFNKQKTLPEFLYSENKEYDKPPSPGDFTHYNGKAYRWQKFASQDGGIIDLGDNYKDPADVFAYVYCSISSDSSIVTSALVSGNSAMDIFCNGSNIYSGAMPGEMQERKVPLTLKAGINHILLKVPESETGRWLFTFRLEDSIPVINHKHKYRLESKIKNYEAD